MKRHQVVVDCLSQWPSVASNESVSSVLNRMKTSGATALPVTCKGSFYGIIKQIDLLTHLHIDHEKQRAALLAAAHDLRSPIASITKIGRASCRERMEASVDAGTVREATESETFWSGQYK